MTQNKKIWIELNSELYERMKNIVNEKLGISFSLFCRSSLYSIYLQLLEKEPLLKPTSEQHLKQIIFQEEKDAI